MTEVLRPFTLDPEKAKAGRERILREDAPLRDADAPDSHAPRQERRGGHDRTQQDSREDFDLTVVRRSD
jgi:hypothetical protein